MAETSNLPIIEGTRPPAESDFYAEWGRETVKSNITLLNDSLRQFLTLNVTLLGGSIVFLKPEMIQAGFRSFALALFALSLLACLVGITPLESKVDIRKPDDVRSHKQKVFSWKRKCLWVAAVLLMFGLTAAAVGVSAFRHSISKPDAPCSRTAP